jgi:hypothetical protein
MNYNITLGLLLALGAFFTYAAKDGIGKLAAVSLGM